MFHPSIQISLIVLSFEVVVPVSRMSTISAFLSTRFSTS